MKKPHINFIVIGHVDHGKSTFVGRMLYDLGAIEKHIIDKYKVEAEKLGKVMFEFAWVMDRLKDERKRGITIDLSHKEFETDKRKFTIIDSPGHKDFVKNMITGASQADAAVLLVSALEGPMSQTKEHLFLCRTFGIKQLVVLINMRQMAKYEEEQYLKRKEEMEILLKKYGYNISKIEIIPIDAYNGKNISKISEEFKWYNGKTVIEAINNFESSSVNLEDQFFRMPIEDVYSIKGIGVVPVGRIESGKIEKGMHVIIPSGKKAEVKSVQMHHKEYSKGIPGMNVGINLKGIEKHEIKRGDIICDIKDSSPNVSQFRAQITVLDYPTMIVLGYSPIIHVHTAQIPCRFIKIEKIIDPKTMKSLDENPKGIKKGDFAQVILESKRPLTMESIKKFPKLARFAIRDMGKTIAAGICLEIVK